MKPSLTALSLLSLATLGAAQDPTVSGFPQPTSSPSWGTVTTDEQVALRYDQAPGEYTVLMVHTCVDSQVSGVPVAKGVGVVLPFMVLPPVAGWAHSDPEITALANDYEFSGQPLMVPPRRVAQHVQTFVASGYHSDYGTTTTTPISHYLLAPGDVVANDPGAGDERIPFAGSNWIANSSVTQTFNATNFGYASVIQAAHEYHATIAGLPPLDPAALDQLTTFLDNDLGFAMHVQALHITPPGGGNTKVRVRVSSHVKLRRRSLNEDPSSLFEQAHGMNRWIPWPIDPTAHVSFAELGQPLMFDFGTPVGYHSHETTLTALMPTTSGYREVEQIPNPLHEDGTPDRPNIGLFPTPMDAQPGLIFFFVTSHPHEQIPDQPQLILPLHGFSDGALMIPYDPNDSSPAGAL